MSLKGTFFDSFIPSSEGDDKPLKKEDGSEEIEPETGAAAKAMPYADEEELEEEEENEESEQEDSEEEEEEEDAPSGQDDNEDVEDIDDEPLAEVINALAEEGVLVYDPEKEYSSGADGFREVVLETVEAEKKKWIDEIPSDYQSIINHLKAGKPLDEWVQHAAATDYSEADLDDPETQKGLIERHLRATGMDEEDIQEELETAEDAGLLERKAKIAQKFLIKNQAAEKAAYEKEITAEAKRREQEAEQAEEYLKETIFETKELGGFKLDKKKQQELFDHITKPVTRDGKTQLMVNQTNPKNQLLAAYLDMLGYDFKDVEKMAATKVSKGLNQALSRVTHVNAKRTGGKGVRENKPSARIPKGIWDTRREVED